MRVYPRGAVLLEAAGRGGSRGQDVGLAGPMGPEVQGLRSART